MRYKYFYLALLLEAVICVIFALPQIQLSGMFTTITAFPFEQIGWGLRQLSLSGAAGNLAAVVFYLLLSLLPCAVYCFLWAKKRLCRADWLLIIMSALLFFVNYYMINPGLCIRVWRETENGCLAVAFTQYSAVILYCGCCTFIQRQIPGNCRRL